MRVSAATPEPTRVGRWEAFMLFATIASLVLVAYVEVRDIEPPSSTFRLLATLDLAFVALFLGDFVARLIRAEDRARFLRANWIDLTGLVPLWAEGLSWLRAFRVLRVLRVVRLVPAGRRAVRALSFVRRVLEASRLGATISIAAAFVVVMAVGFYFVEEGHNPAVRSIGDALWWAVTTVTTVGYGDVVPRTGIGRGLAAVLMMLGIGLFGVVASSLSAAIAKVARGDDPESPIEALLRAHEDLVLRRERGEVDAEAFEQRKRDLLSVARGASGDGRQ